MPKDKNVNIRLELSRDDKGKLSIVAHFNSKASNIIIDKNEYRWMPTLEEKDLINEAFSFIPGGVPSDTSKKVSPDITKTEVEPEIVETEVKEEKIPEPEPEPETIFEKEPEIETKKEEPVGEPKEPSVFEKLKGEAVFKVTDENEEPTPDITKENEEPVKEMEPDVSVKEDISDKKDEIPEEDDGLIVEADEEAIIEALKKHDKDEEMDKSMREVDEKTIIDRVLKQKKKGKWSRK